MAADSEARDAASSAQNTELRNLVSNSFGALTQEIAGIQVQVTEVTTTVKSQGKKLDKLADDYARLSAHMAKLDGQFSKSNSIEHTLADIKDDEYERKPDLTVFRLNTPESVDKALVKPAFQKWIEDSNVDPDNVHIEGPPQGQRFVLRFNHKDEGTRVRAAVQAASALRVDGIWRRFATHTGITIYLERDKNARRQREEIIAKRVLKCIPSTLKPYLDRRSETNISIRINKEQLAEISCPTRDAPPSIQWDNAFAKQCELNPVDIDVRALAAAPITGKVLGRAECL
jgi:hypothetical protein